MQQIEKQYLQTVGQRVAWARRKADLTQSQLADRVGVTQQQISALEKDKLCSPGKLLMMKISKEVGVPAPWLLFGVEEIGNLSEAALRLALAWDRLPDSATKELVRQAVEEHAQSQSPGSNHRTTF